MTAPRKIPLETIHQIEAMVLAHHPAAEIAAATGVALSTVAMLRREIGLAVDGSPLPHREAASLWGTMTTDAIAAKLGCHPEVVRRMARVLCLGRNAADPAPAIARPAATPSRPRRYTRDELAWAAAHRTTDPQARLIAAMVMGHPAPDAFRATR